MEILNIYDIRHDLEQMDISMKRAFEDLDVLYQLKNKLNNTNISTESIRLSNIVLNNITRRQLNTSLIISQEDIGDFISRIIEAIKNAIKWIINKIKQFWYWITGTDKTDKIKDNKTVLNTVPKIDYIRISDGFTINGSSILSKEMDDFYDKLEIDRKKTHRYWASQLGAMRKKIKNRINNTGGYSRYNRTHNKLLDDLKEYEKKYDNMSAHEYKNTHNIKDEFELSKLIHHKDLDHVALASIDNDNIFIPFTTPVISKDFKVFLYVMTGYTSGYNYENVSKAILKGSDIFRGLLKLYRNVNNNVINHTLKEYSTIFLHSDGNTNSNEYKLLKEKFTELENKIFSELNKTGFIDLLKPYEISTSIKEDNIHDGLTTVITGSENNLYLFKNNYKNEEDSVNYFLNFAKSPLETNSYVTHNANKIEQIELIYDDTSTVDIKRRYDAFLKILDEVDNNRSFLNFTDGENSVESYCLKTIERSNSITDHDKRRILNVVNTLLNYKTAILNIQMKLIKILEIDCNNYYNHIIRSLI